jgi:hypothetical protein
MFEFTNTLWLSDATSSLKNILDISTASKAFMDFLKTEYGEAQLEFFLEVQKLEAMDAASQPAKAQEVFNTFMTTSGKGIGQQERTAATQEMWDKMNKEGAANVDGNGALTKLRAEAESTLQMLAFDAFPRFVKSKECAKCVDAMKSAGGNADLEGMLGKAKDAGPKDADDWLNNFVATAESFPAVR